MVVQGCHGDRGMLPSSTSVRLQICLALPGTDTANSRLPLEVAVVEIVHPRCAGLDVSKRDAKCCVRVAGRGRAGTKSTVSTWGSVPTQWWRCPNTSLERRAPS